ncbi:aspartyl/asparaginyl beta-hydroxylase domain-containing protein [Pseudoalteromonas sp. Of7M-16]|uniref:aspartyl/asparaginyl beta-hydroxylase domain-containing protein n=1 Tax=Pseudoalteromonas sp. Of7M-16 TaxID=2917756 RepID=UPI001EF6D742|nr:aspartyl/asparaginyl beta-hydroxylase domain-containing protein [Pseudoalteromonas sp. Of7M-16]MCG7550236.1 aspartyl/asparaginyl beta-hydroxylase domain-containing protein [Pseudoalteromonas sp. Of7M-16]
MSTNIGKYIDNPIAFAKLALNCDFTALKDEVLTLNELTWYSHVNASGFSGHWNVLPLYANQAHANAHPILQCFSIEEQNAQYGPLPIMDRLPTLKSFLAQFKCPLKSVRLMRLEADSHILPHRDHRLSMEYGEARIHVPISGSDQVEFVVSNRVVPMKCSEVWYLNADLEHSVSNLGAVARINLVIDCKVGIWLKNLIESSEQKF